MSTKHVRTVSDLVRFRCSLRIDCGECGSTKTVTGYEAAKIGGVGSLEALARRLKCARCGQKSAKLIVLQPL
ncbi:MAG: hypothetical protein NVSMB6_28580 [Burkholderiaceae bacterium]